MAATSIKRYGHEASPCRLLVRSTVIFAGTTLRIFYMHANKTRIPRILDCHLAGPAPGCSNPAPPPGDSILHAKQQWLHLR